MKTSSITLLQVIGCNFSIISLALASATFPVTCPKEIQTTQSLISPHAKWEIIVSEPRHFLQGISFYSGNPKALANLKPDVINNTEAKWSFNETEAIHIVCRYNQTVLQLARALPAKIKSCKVIFDPLARGEEGYIPQKIDCVN